MKYYLHFKENEIIGCSLCPCLCEEFECREVTEQEYQAYQKTIEEKQVIQQRIAEIKLWFEEYDNQVKQYERCVRLGIEFDKDMVELDNQADAYQKELRKLDYKKQSEYN